jgi:hypothetical protein
MKTSDARIKEIERKLGASCLEELVLKKSLSEAHAESKCSGGGSTQKVPGSNQRREPAKAGRGRSQRTINFFTNEVEKMKLSHVWSCHKRREWVR